MRKTAREARHMYADNDATPHKKVSKAKGSKAPQAKQTAKAKPKKKDAHKASRQKRDSGQAARTAPGRAG